MAKTNSQVNQSLKEDPKQNINPSHTSSYEKVDRELEIPNPWESAQGHKKSKVNLRQKDTPEWIPTPDPIPLIAQPREDKKFTRPEKAHKEYTTAKANQIQMEVPKKNLQTKTLSSDSSDGFRSLNKINHHVSKYDLSPITTLRCQWIRFLEDPEDW